jgi:hypothetical protein
MLDAGPNPEPEYITFPVPVPLRQKNAVPAVPQHYFPPYNYSSLGRYVFGSEISYNKAPPRLPGLGC